MAFQLASLDESGVVNIWVRHLVYYIFCSFPHFSLKILFWNIFSNLSSVLYNAYFPYEKFPKLWRYYRYHRQILLWGGGGSRGCRKIKRVWGSCSRSLSGVPVLHRGKLQYIFGYWIQFLDFRYISIPTSPNSKTAVCQSTRIIG